MATNNRLEALREEFETGVNPAVFVPYAAALRHAGLLSPAIEVCLAGLAGNPGSVAGQTLLGRLYCDIGSYQESRAILETVCRMAPQASGVQVALARTLVRMHETDRAEELIGRLRAEIPGDPEVQVLQTALRHLKDQRSRPGSTPPHAPVSPPPTTLNEVVELLVSRVGAVAKVQGAVLVSLAGTFDRIDFGQVHRLPETIEAYHEIQRACQELEMGEVRSGEIELDSALILFARRGDELVLLWIDPSPRMGPARVMFDWSLTYLFPPAFETVSREIEA